MLLAVANPLQIDPDNFLVVVSVAAVAGVTAMLLQPRLAIPVVVIELVLGIIVGPQVADLAYVGPGVSFFRDLGLGMLFFFAGYEIDFERIKGEPLKRAGLGWIMSLGLAYAFAGGLAAAGVVVSGLYTGSAMATTAIGTLIPILHDSGELRTRFGGFLLGAGAAGEFGPILLVTLILSTGHPLDEALLLVLFVALAAFTGVLAVRSAFRGWSYIERATESSSQLPVRLAVLLVFGLVALATNLGLDLLLGGFVAGVITRLALRGREVALLESKLTAIGYGFLIPFFFVASGMAFDAEALFTSTSALLKLPLFVALFLVVRGLPALLLYRGVLPSRDRVALGVFSATQLPLVVAITTLALEAHKMRQTTASALVGAAIISTMCFPLIGMWLRRGRREREVAALEAAPA